MNNISFPKKPVEWLESLIKPSLKEYGLLFSEKIMGRRAINQMKIIQKAQEYAEKHNIKVRQLPIKLLGPMLNNASWEEDDTIQNKWIALLVNAADSEKRLKSHVIYKSFLQDLSSIEIQLLDFLYDKKEEGTNIQMIEEYFDITTSEKENLQRLNLINWEVMLIDKNLIDSSTKPHINNKGQIESLTLTSLGQNFVETCRLDD